MLSSFVTDSTKRPASLCETDDGSVDISDAVRDFQFCFSGASIPCTAACDSDGDGNPCTGVTDGVRVLMYLFRGWRAAVGTVPEVRHGRGRGGLRDSAGELPVVSTR